MTKLDAHEAGTICWVDLMTSDAEAARELYKGLFGWTFVLGGPEAGHYALAQLDDLPVAGVGPLPPGAQSPPGWTVYFASDDADATVARVSEHGGSVAMGPIDVMQEGRMAVCADPTGAAFGVWQAKRHVGARVIDEPNAMCWYEVATPDGVKARDFYAKVFGLDAKQLVEPGGPPMEYYTLHKGAKVVGGVMEMRTQPPHWMVYFAVADADAAAAKVVELGGTVSMPPVDTPYGRVAIVSDRSGAVFSIIKLAS